MWADGPVMEVHEGLGKRVPVLAGEADWQRAQFKDPECCRVSVFRAHQTAQEKRRPRGLSGKKHRVPDDEGFISIGQSQRDGWFRSHSLSSVTITALKRGYFLRLIVHVESSPPDSLGGWNEGEGGAEIRGDGADGSRSLSARVSLFHLNRPVRLHCSRATVWCSVLAAGWVNNMLM